MYCRQRTTMKTIRVILFSVDSTSWGTLVEMFYLIYSFLHCVSKPWVWFVGETRAGLCSLMTNSLVDTKSKSWHQCSYKDRGIVAKSLETRDMPFFTDMFKWYDLEFSTNKDLFSSGYWTGFWTCYIKEKKKNQFMALVASVSKFRNIRQISMHFIMLN